jgi:hypothetical protein
MQYPTTEVLIAFFDYIYEYAGKSSNLYLVPNNQELEMFILNVRLKIILFA